MAQEKMNMNEAKDEINLGKKANRIKRTFDEKKNSSKNSLYPDMEQKEFIELLDKTPSYTHKTQIDKFNEWKSFIKRKGYLPRISIKGKDKMTVKMTKAEKLEETRLGRWAIHLESVPMHSEKAQAEFYNIKNKTPNFLQKYGR